MVVMNVKRLFVAAGIAWGIVLGIAGGIYAGGIAAGFAWLFLFGDDSWPDWGEYAILGVAVAVGLGDPGRLHRTGLGRGAKLRGRRGIGPGARRMDCRGPGSARGSGRRGRGVEPSPKGGSF